MLNSCPMEVREMGEFEATTEPVIGLIHPPANRPVPDEAQRMYPTGVKFLVTGLGLAKMSPEGYDAVVPKVANAAIESARQRRTGYCINGHFPYVL